MIISYLVKRAGKVSQVVRKYHRGDEPKKVEKRCMKRYGRLMNAAFSK